MSQTNDIIQNAKSVANLLKQLSNDNRLMLLCSIAEKEMTVGELNKQIQLSQSAISQHLTKLRANNIVVTRRESQKIYYRIEDDDIRYLLEVLQTRFCQSIK